jgi:hypothetical protein
MGKTIDVEGNTSSGQPIGASFTEIRGKAGTLGFVPELREPLKPGEPATLKMPGGGSVVIGVAKEGDAPNFPARTAKQPAR